MAFKCTASTVKGAGEITDAVVNTVSGSLVNAIKHTGDVGVAISEVVRGVILGVAEIGGDLGRAAKGAVIGVLRGTKEVGGEALDAVSKTAGAVVKNTAELGGDLGSAAKGAVEGAITGAKDLGLSAEEAASAAATGGAQGCGRDRLNRRGAGARRRDGHDRRGEGDAEVAVEEGGLSFRLRCAKAKATCAGLAQKHSHLRAGDYLQRASKPFHPPFDGAPVRIRLVTFTNKSCLHGVPRSGLPFRARGESSVCSLASPFLAQLGSHHLVSFGARFHVGELLARLSGSLRR